MEDPGKLIEESRSPLTTLFRMLLFEKMIDASTWNSRVTRFLKSNLSDCPKNAKDVGQERNNFNRAVARDNITFRTFQKAVEIMGPVKYSMTITLEDRNGRQTQVTTPWIRNPLARLDELSSAVTPVRDAAPISINFTDIDSDEDDDDFDDDLDLDLDFSDE